MCKTDWESIINTADGYIVLTIKDGKFKSYLDSKGEYTKIVDRLFKGPNKSNSFEKETTNKKQKEV